MALQTEIDDKKKEIHTDGYPMSLGELARLYQDNELDIHPEFQRIFRWGEYQKTKLVESILLGIPVPPIFVSQRDDGVWDVVDGVQRLSTIFQLMGILKNEDGEHVEPLTLSATDYLPSLHGKSWQNENNESHSFTQAQRIMFKREKLDLRIIKKESDPETKYELFQRLNTLGTSLSDQEVRNCLLIMLNRNFFEWLTKLADDAAFRTTLSLPDKQIDRRYDMELALRFLAYHRADEEALSKMSDVGEFITDSMKEMADDPTFDMEGHERIFRETFSVLAEACEDEAFKKYESGRNRFLGGFSVSSFEMASTGVSHNIEKIQLLKDRSSWLREKIKGLWASQNFQKNSGAGVRGTTRAAALVPFGRQYFSP